MSKITIRCLIAVMALVIASSDGAQAEETDAALEAATGWLKLVDDGKYRESWENTAQYFRKAVSYAQWEKAMQSVREPLGQTMSRQLKAAQYTTSLPGAPDGHYVVIQFTASFVNKKEAIETVTPMKDPDGQWRVSGYYIK